MVDRTSRDLLAEMVRNLLAGHISMDDFQLEGETLVQNSGDLGLQEIFCYVSPIHDDLNSFFPVRFGGWIKLLPEMQRRIAVAVLFLYSDLEYEGPHNCPHSRGGCLDELLCVICGLSVCGGLMLWPLALLSPWFLIIPCVLLIQSPLIYRFSKRLTKRFQVEWEKDMGRFGDYEVWPFLRRADFEAAKENSPLLPGDMQEDLWKFG